jgi:hypothetical protein
MKNRNKPSDPKPSGEANSLPQVPVPDSVEAATLIQEVTTAMVLAKCDPHGITKEKGPVAYQMYRHKVLIEAGNSNDPLETMLVEQLMMAHQTIGSLYVRAADSNDPAAINLLTSGAARLMAESRKTLMAIREYRTPTGPQQLTIVKQQNLAGGDQQVAYLDKSGSQTMPEKNLSDSKLGPETMRMLDHDDEPELVPIPETSYRRRAEPIEAKRTHLRRPRSAQIDGEEEPALAPLNGSTHCGR